MFRRKKIKKCCVSCKFYNQGCLFNREKNISFGYIDPNTYCCEHYVSIRNKYGVSDKEQRTCDGIVFDSKKEMLRYKELILLSKAREISELQRQVKFELQPKFVTKDGETIRAINYIADFVYWDNNANCLVIEDVKGAKTKEYMIKKKMLLYIVSRNSEYIFKET